jgi:hypothetical protein
MRKIFTILFLCGACLIACKKNATITLNDIKEKKAPVHISNQQWMDSITTAGFSGNYKLKRIDWLLHSSSTIEVEDTLQFFANGSGLINDTAKFTWSLDKPQGEFPNPQINLVNFSNFYSALNDLCINDSLTTHVLPYEFINPTVVSKNFILDAFKTHSNSENSAFLFIEKY